ncbi:putative phospholipid:diacylglycerol acyltransferase 2 [Nicotiana sylvestris]|uniref:phospholipid:diacylglycerol acyltransferase n=2 Tax=Nicotiana TaxID=4085 RepID=A0A1S3XRQ0_TOBAC|nr:PREDICTED: putative phospholipid:diacylglycerol acyltransferase 2 [Nicotiana sylvestris]XP_016442623.1 PREDICTED: putative phospholipid:diacylglycerol acyltransferase 2 [Nicotiana tabacum]
MGFFHFLKTQLSRSLQLNLSAISNYVNQLISSSIVDCKVRILTSLASILGFRKLCFLEPTKCSPVSTQSFESNVDKKQENAVSAYEKVIEKPKHKKTKRQPKEWRCIDYCCWIIGYLCTTWWLLLFLCNFLPANLPGLKVPEPPGTRLKNEGLIAHHPLVLVPGIVTGGLELWEGRPCSEGLFRKRLWGGSFAEIFKRPLCWLEHLSLDNETGLDPPGIRVRAVTGLVAADYFAPGYFVWAILIENLAKIGYEQKNMYMASYDWRLSFQNTEIRDQSLSRLKRKIELLYVTNGNRKVVVVPHSMGVIYFLHFLKWVEAPPPVGGGGGPNWCAKHIKTIMNVSPAFLGVPKAVANILSAEGKDVAFIRAMAPGLLDSETFGFQTFQHVMRVFRTWDSVLSLLPKGGETIWGDLNWSPEEENVCHSAKTQYLQSSSKENNGNDTSPRRFAEVKQRAKYGRLVAFGKAASELPSSQLSFIDPKEFVHGSAPISSTSCEELLTEYDEISRESIKRVAENEVYTARTLIDLLRFIAPKMMQRTEEHFSHGLAENLEDPKYSHHKYWSNPLETMLPDAPDMEIYCSYGVGIPTERSYVYKMSPSDRCKSIPLQIDSSADGSDNGCLSGGVYFVDGDESVPVVSAGFMCAKGWRGKTRFNPSGIATYVREYQHNPPASLLEGRGTESGAHVDILGNFALIEDVLRVAAGASGTELGGDRIYSGIMEMSERINIRL